jgi:predicted GH43/DUF377 family glycosyl hydrolase
MPRNGHRGSVPRIDADRREPGSTATVGTPTPARVPLTAENVPSQTVGRTTGVVADDMVTRKRLRLNRDPSRVIVKLFVPGTHAPQFDSRAQAVVDRILALSDADAESSYQRIVDGFAGRHRDLEATFAEHYRAIAHRIPRDVEVNPRRRLLIGAHFTSEYAIEGAAFTNPSMIEHPDQSGLRPDERRFLMSARSIGEGHLSCVEFRSGVVDSAGGLRVEDPVPYACVGSIKATTYRRSMLEAAVTGTVSGNEVLAYLHHNLPEVFTEEELEHELGSLPPQLLVLEQTHRSLTQVHWFIGCQYRLAFPADTVLSERVLWPTSPAERRGMEDARLVRFVEDDGSVTYKGTYTAYDGMQAHCQLLETADFRDFTMTQLFGAAVGSKGLALFPRKVNGHYLAMSRCDNENNGIAMSADGRTWHGSKTIKLPNREWELIQTGNCGSPIETPEGWLVLTHGVGPMRVYAIGAMLLDLADPTRVIGALNDPLLIASPEERDGYVPNVVYSCGAMLHEDVLVIPYGFGDMGIEFATVSLSGLLRKLVESGY